MKDVYSSLFSAGEPSAMAADWWLAGNNRWYPPPSQMSAASAKLLIADHNLRVLAGFAGLVKKSDLPTVLARSRCTDETVDSGLFYLRPEVRPWLLLPLGVLGVAGVLLLWVLMNPDLWESTPGTGRFEQDGWQTGRVLLFSSPAWLGVLLWLAWWPITARHRSFTRRRLDYLNSLSQLRAGADFVRAMKSAQGAWEALPASWRAVYREKWEIHERPLFRLYDTARATPARMLARTASDATAFVGDLTAKARSGQSPVSDWRGAEERAAAWLRQHVDPTTRITRGGADGGIDAVGERCIAQVKWWKNPVPLNEVQRVAGIAATEGKTAYFFARSNGSAAAFTEPARRWAARSNVKLLKISQDGDVTAA